MQGQPISSGLTPIVGKAAAGMVPQQNPAKPAALLPNGFLKVFLAACKLQEKLFCS